jgi:hypothetical protein
MSGLLHVRLRGGPECVGGIHSVHAGARGGRGNPNLAARVE